MKIPLHLLPLILFSEDTIINYLICNFLNKGLKERTIYIHTNLYTEVIFKIQMKECSIFFMTYFHLMYYKYLRVPTLALHHFFFRIVDGS